MVILEITWRETKALSFMITAFCNIRRRAVWYRYNKIYGIISLKSLKLADCVWNVMAHVQKPDFVFRRNGRVHLNRRGRQFSRLLAAEVCASAVVMLDTPCSEVVWKVLATHSIRQFPLHFSSHASPCAITFQLDSTHPCDQFKSDITTFHLVLWHSNWTRSINC